MSRELMLDFVSHISLVDEPAVGDSKYLIMKRYDEDGDDPLEVLKEGRTLSQANQERLQEILETADSGKIDQAATQLEAFLDDTTQDGQTDGDSNGQASPLEMLKTQFMSDGDGDQDTDLDQLVDSIRKAAAEGVQEGMEAATDSDGDGDGGSDGDAPSVEDLQDEISTLQEQISTLTDGGSGDGDGDGDGSGASDGDGDDPDDALEKRLETLEKTLQEQDGEDVRKGLGSAADNLDEDVHSEGGISIQSQVQKDLQGDGQQEAGD